MHWFARTGFCNACCQRPGYEAGAWSVTRADLLGPILQAYSSTSGPMHIVVVDHGDADMHFMAKSSQNRRPLNALPRFRPAHRQRAREVKPENRPNQSLD